MLVTMHNNQVAGRADQVRQLRLRNPQHSVSRKAKPMWAAEAAIGWIVLLVLEILAATLGWFGAPGWVWAAVLPVTVVLGAAHTVLMPIIRYRVHRWETTPEAVYTQSGWLSIEWRIAPISRIQTVDTKRDPIERLFGLSSVTVTTASAAGPVEIKGLDHDVALSLADELTASTSTVEGDAT
jgi:hypothetical protein